MAPTTAALSSALSPPQPAPPLRPLSASSNTETIDITKGRKLLKRISQSALTPRKRALARKASLLHDDVPSPAFSPGSSPSVSSQRSAENLHLLGDQFESDERITLFDFPSAEIFTFDDYSTNVTDSKSQGRLLGHGKLEIFQLHQQKVTYLQCGSVVHPILPRLKILKISKNQFILPLSNPERYWRIVIATGDVEVLKSIEGAFSKVCHFRNLFIQTGSDDQVQPLITEKPLPEVATIVESTPVARFETPLNIAPVKKSESLSSITTAVACFNLESDTSTYVEDAPPPEDIPLERTTSRASTLDMALDGFFQEPEQTLFYTPDPSIIFAHAEESRDTITTTPSLPQHYQSSLNPNISSSLHLPKRRTQSRSSRSTSLYQTESSWMDPTDDIMTSTPSTQRYIKLNLDPTPKTKGKVLHENVTSIVAEPILKKTVQDRTKYRYSSMDVYQMVKEANVNGTEEASFSGFLKSFF